MLRYDRQTKPGLFAFYDIRPGNGAGLFFQLCSPQGALTLAVMIKQIPKINCIRCMSNCRNVFCFTYLSYYLNKHNKTHYRKHKACDVPISTLSLSSPSPARLYARIRARYVMSFATLSITTDVSEALAPRR